MEKVLITPKSYYEVRRSMLPLLGGIEVVFNETGRTLTEAEMEEFVGDIDGLIVGVDPVTRRVLERAGRLRALSKYGTGIDNIDLEALNARRIPLRTTPGANSVSVAELTLGLLLTCARNICFSAQAVKGGEWKRRPGIELTGKTLGLVGCGNIGREVASRARGLSLSVLLFDPYFNDPDFLERHAVEVVTLEELLSRSDFVSLHLPLTGDTRKIIGRDQLEFMKPGAFLVNTSRGELIDDEALLWALENLRIAGAASDVFTREPPGSHPLIKLDNFILTPHIGANTREAVLRTAHAATRNLIEMLEGGR